MGFERVSNWKKSDEEISNASAFLRTHAFDLSTNAPLLKKVNPFRNRATEEKAQKKKVVAVDFLLMSVSEVISKNIYFFFSFIHKHDNEMQKHENH